MKSFQPGWAHHTLATHDAQQALEFEDIGKRLGNSAEMVRRVYATWAVKPLPAKPPAVALLGGVPLVHQESSIRGLYISQY